MVKRNHQKQQSQSAPVSGFNSPSSSSYTSREPSPKMQPQHPQHKYNYKPWLIGGGITLPLAFGTRWLLNRPSVQALIARRFNRGNRIVESTYDQPQIQSVEESEQPKQPEDCDSEVVRKPSHSPLPISTPVGADDL